jgi:hypothetical protein
MTTVARVLVIQVVVFLTGALLIWWAATPLYFDQISALESISWPLLLVPALALAVPSGAFAGLSIRGRWPLWIAGLVLVLIGLPAIYAPFFFVAHWPGSTVLETNFTDLVAALLGWSLYGIASSALAVGLGRLGRRHLRDSPRATLGRES